MKHLLNTLAVLGIIALMVWVLSNETLAYIAAGIMFVAIPVYSLINNQVKK